MTQTDGRQRPLDRLAGSCNRHFCDTSAYLKDILERLPTHASDRLGNVVPDTWIVANPHMRPKLVS
jgi:hypothetical protein